MVRALRLENSGQAKMKEGATQGCSREKGKGGTCWRVLPLLELQGAEVAAP